MKQCRACGKELQIERKVGRSEMCPHCGADLHVCLNCVFYSPEAYNECREPQAEWVTDRERRNFCDYFKLDPVGRPGAARGRADSARKKLDDLFKTKEPDTE